MKEFMAARTKLAAQIDPEILAKTKEIAEKEGRQNQSLVEEALVDLIEKRQASPKGMSFEEAYKESLERFSSVYERLAR